MSVSSRVRTQLVARWRWLGHSAAAAPRAERAVNNAAGPTRGLHRAAAVAGSGYHRRRGGLGEIQGVSADWTDLPGPAETLYWRLGLSANGKIGPDLFKRDQGGIGKTLEPVEYNPTTADTFPLLAVMNPVNFDQDMFAKMRFIHEERNASQPLYAPEPEHEPVVLDYDPRCGSARHSFVFTDTSPGHDEHTRRIFVRDPDGTLRTAGEDERKTVHQMYFARQNETSRAPGVIQDPDEMAAVLAMFQHAHLLDEICRIRHSSSADYITTHCKVFNHINQEGCFQVLQDTPHWQGMMRYLVQQGKIHRLCSELLAGGRASDCHAVVVAYFEAQPEHSFNVNLRERLQKSFGIGITHPDELPKFTAPLTEKFLRLYVKCRGGDRLLAGRLERALATEAKAKALATAQEAG